MSKKHEGFANAIIDDGVLAAQLDDGIKEVVAKALEDYYGKFPGGDLEKDSLITLLRKPNSYLVYSLVMEERPCPECGLMHDDTEEDS